MSDCSNHKIEIWSEVIGYEGLYQVSNIGRIKNLNRKGSLMRIHNNIFGYPRVCLTKDGKQRAIYVHVLVAKAFIKNPLNKKYVNHKDGDKANNNVINLEWVSGSENAIHAYKTGLRKAHPLIGENQCLSKLTDKDIKPIRKSNKSHSVLGKIYGVCATTIGKVKKRETWKHIA